MFVDGEVRLLVFLVGRERFGIPLADVEEVIDAPEIQRVPDAPQTVLGITRARGAFVTTYDPRPLLHVSQPPAAGGRVAGAALLFTRGNQRIALAVDDVFDALAIRDDELRPPPSVGLVDGCVSGVIRRGADLIAVLDCPALLDAATAAHAEAGERKHS